MALEQGRAIWKFGLCRLTVLCLQFNQETEKMTVEVFFMLGSVTSIHLRTHVHSRANPRMEREFASFSFSLISQTPLIV